MLNNVHYIAKISTWQLLLEKEHQVPMHSTLVICLMTIYTIICIHSLKTDNILTIHDLANADSHI